MNWTDLDAPSPSNAHELADAIVDLTRAWDFVTHGNLCSRFGDICRGDQVLRIESLNVAILHRRNADPGRRAVRAQAPEGRVQAPADVVVCIPAD
jgi:hypothetical protein